MEQTWTSTLRADQPGAKRERRKILVLSEHGIVRHGLKLMLGAATSHLVLDDEGRLEEIGTAMSEHRPDIVVADVSTRPDGLSLLVQAMRPAATRCKVLAICAPGAVPAPDVLESVIPGARAVCAADDPVHLLHALRGLLDRVSAPQPAFSPDRQASSAPALPAEALRVTPREREVIELITQGLCSKRIARTLNISVTTVRTHRQRLMSKLGLRNSIEVAQFAAKAFGAGVLTQAGSTSVRAD